MNGDLISRWYAPGTAGESKRIYDSDEIMVDYRDGMLRISQFVDGHWVDEHFVEIPVVHAHWIRVGWGYYKCSHCEAEIGSYSGHKSYCANCGAKMDEQLELRTCYCPICDKHFQVRSNDSMGNCPDCGHHVVLHRMEVDE